MFDSRDFLPPEEISPKETETFESPTLEGERVYGLVEVEGVEDLEKDLLPAMLAQVGNQRNVGNQNGNVVNENVQENDRNVLVNGKRVGCSYKEFLACNPKEYDGKGGVVVLTRWIEKMENLQDMKGCSIDQKVKYTAGSFVVRL
nr:reverse transcriptase domain-containing protein [Tanacetum cinerariifolium]